MNALTAKEKRLVIIMGVLFVFTIIAPGFVTQFANDYLREQRALKNALEKEIIDLGNRISGIADEREQVRANQEDYLNWVSRGVVGEQDPVGWVKTMKAIQENRKLFPLTYKFASEVLQAPSASPFTADSTVQIRLWDMTMDMAMLHDLDAMMFLESLDQEIESFFFPVDCTFNLLEPEFSLIARQNMTSSCRLTWISVVDPEIKVEG